MEDFDLKPAIVKLESELILDENDEGPFHVITAQTPSPGLEQNPSMQLEKIDVNFMNNFSATTRSTIKEEDPEDTPVTGPSQEVIDTPQLTRKLIVLLHRLDLSLLPDFVPRIVKTENTQNDTNVSVSDHQLNVEHFTFYEAPLGINDSTKEIIRDARVQLSKEFSVSSHLKSVSKPKPKPVPVLSTTGKTTHKVVTKPRNPSSGGLQPQFTGIEAESSVSKSSLPKLKPAKGDEDAAEFSELAKIKPEIGDDLTDKSQSTEAGALKVLDKSEHTELSTELGQLSNTYESAQLELLASSISESNKGMVHANKAGSETCQDHLKTDGLSTKEPVLLTTIKKEADPLSDNEINNILKEEPFEFEENDTCEENQDPVLDDDQQICPLEVHFISYQPNLVFSQREINSKAEDNPVECEQEIRKEESRTPLILKVNKNLGQESSSVLKIQSSSGMSFPRHHSVLLKSEVTVGSENYKNGHNKGKSNQKISKGVAASPEQASQPSQSIKYSPNESGKSHSEVKTHASAHCSTKYKSKSSITQHGKIHLEERLLSCNQRSPQFRRKCELNRNLPILSGKKVFSCQQCSAKFRYESKFKRHLQTHSGEKPFSCEQCQAQFCQKGVLKRHLRIHSGEKPFSCEQCQAQFRQKGVLKRHLRIHSGEKPFSCEQCRAQFSLKSTLQHHLRIHSGEKPFSCEQCRAQFSRKATLQQHLRTHSGEKPFSCEQCRAQFSRIGNLKSHLRTHSGEKPFSCEQCRAQFGRKATLQQHLRSHSGEKPFSCEQCRAQFSQISSLKSHLRTHSGEKPFSCEQCRDQFGRKASLQQHLRTHSGEKPFSCEHCQSQFRQKSTLII